MAKKVIKEVNAFKGKQVGASTSFTLTKGENIVMKIYCFLFLVVVLGIMVDSIIHGEPNPAFMLAGIGGIILVFWILFGIMFWRHRDDAKKNMTTYNENVNTFKKNNDN